MYLQKVSSALSVEDRLRKLLNSDTESVDGSSKLREVKFCSYLLFGQILVRGISYNANLSGGYFFKF